MLIVIFLDLFNAHINIRSIMGKLHSLKLLQKEKKDRHFNSFGNLA
jgi:hypothetical protein